MPHNKRSTAISGLIVGDELGLIKRIDLELASLNSSSPESVVTINRDLLDAPTPDKGILSIRPFKNQTLMAAPEDSDETDSSDEDDADDVCHDVTRGDDNKSNDGRESRLKKKLSKHQRSLRQESSAFFLISAKPNKLLIYNSINNTFNQIKPASAVSPSAKLIGSQPMDRNNIIVVYDNGTIYMQNIEKDLFESSTENKAKAIKLLGLDSGGLKDPKTRSHITSENIPFGVNSKDIHTSLDVNHGDKSDLDQGTPSKKRKRKGNSSKSKKSKKGEEFIPNPDFEPESLNISLLFNPNYNTSHISLTCFEVDHHRLAVAGKNVDLKVFDLMTKTCIFTAKSSHTDWLGIRTLTWVSGMTFIGPVNPSTPINIIKSSSKSTKNMKQDNLEQFRCKFGSSPDPMMIATCSRTDPVIRIYDLTRLKFKKPVWCINLKESTFNNDSNPPSFTSITATSSPLICAVPTQQIFVGTTMGRLIAVDLRFNSKSYRNLGVFKGFGGGAIRGLSFVSNGQSCTSGNHRIVSCSLDRFVRIHSFRTGSDPKRTLEHKFYIKTRPTCIQPIINSFVVKQHSSILADDEEVMVHDEDVDDEPHLDEMIRHDEDLMEKKSMKSDVEMDSDGVYDELKKSGKNKRNHQIRKKRQDFSQDDEVHSDEDNESHGDDTDGDEGSEIDLKDFDEV